QMPSAQPDRASGAFHAARPSERELAAPERRSQQMASAPAPPERRSQQMASAQPDRASGAFPAARAPERISGEFPAAHAQPSRPPKPSQSTSLLPSDQEFPKPEPSAASARSGRAPKQPRQPLE